MWSGSCHFSGCPGLQQQQVQQRPGKHYRQFSVFSSMNYRRKSFVLPGRRLFQEATSVRAEWVSEWVRECTQPPAACDWISTLLQSELPLNTHNPINDKRTLQTWHKWGRNIRLTAGRCQFVQREHITQVRWRDSCWSQQQKEQTVRTTLTWHSLLSNWPQFFCRVFIDWNSVIGKREEHLSVCNISGGLLQDGLWSEGRNNFSQLKCPSISFVLPCCSCALARGCRSPCVKWNLHKN